MVGTLRFAHDLRFRSLRTDLRFAQPQSQAAACDKSTSCRLEMVGTLRETHRLTTGIDGYRFAPPILRAVELQQLRLLRRDRIAGTDRAALDHLGVDPTIAVAEPALQRLRDGKVTLGRIRIDVDGGAAD